MEVFMKFMISLLALCASSSAFAYTAGTYKCGPTTYEISNSGVGGLPLVTITGFNGVTYKGLGQVIESKNENNQKVEQIKYNLGARSLQITFVDDKSSCQAN
jgi:hypothetical protein